MFIQNLICTKFHRTIFILLLSAVLLLPVSAGFAETAESMGASTALSDEELLALVTPAYIADTQDMFFDFDAPLPVERINNCYLAWKIRTFGEYEAYLRGLGITDEYWLDVGAKGLYAFDNERMMGREGDFVNYVSREELINDVINENTETFFCDEEGRPLSYLVGFTDQIREGLQAGTNKLMVAGVDNLYEAWRESGAAILYAGEIMPGLVASGALVNHYGVIGFNMNKSSIARVPFQVIINSFARNLAELDSVFFGQRVIALGLNEKEGITGPAFIVYSDTIKLKVYGEMMGSLNDITLNNLGAGLVGQAEERAKEYGNYGVSLGSDLMERLEALLLTCEVPGKKFLVDSE